ncbi:hypothetical protein B0188_04580, partial [[Haemophilus] felis]
MSLQKILKNLALVFILLNINTQVLAKNRINISAEMGVGLAHSRQRQISKAISTLKANKMNTSKTVSSLGWGLKWNLALEVVGSLVAMPVQKEVNPTQNKLKSNQGFLQKKAVITS